MVAAGGLLSVLLAFRMFGTSVSGQHQHQLLEKSAVFSSGVLSDRGGSAVLCMCACVIPLVLCLILTRGHRAGLISPMPALDCYQALGSTLSSCRRPGNSPVVCIVWNVTLGVGGCFEVSFGHPP